MFCRNCGASITVNAAFCGSCGAPVEQSQPNNQQPVEQQPVIQQPVNQQPANQQSFYQQPIFQQPVQDVQFSMKWYKFIIYFALFAGVVLNVFSAISIFTGSIYEAVGISADSVYSAFPKLKGVDMIYGFLLFGISALAFITRQNLAHYKALGINLFYCVYIANIVVSSYYIFATSSIVGTSTATTNFGTQIVVSILMIVFNSMYFNKRKSLFQ